jgi:Protein of unknown function (DUF3108)
LLVDGKASFSTQGTIKGDHPVPKSFTSKIVSSAETSDVTMALDEEGNVKELTATTPPSSDRVPVANSNRQAIVDLLSALLFSASAAGEVLSEEACRRTLPIFDGHRYDLNLAFRRMDKMTAEKGYSGPVAVCSVNYEPIAGPSREYSAGQISFEGREMEIALAPVAGTRLLAPFRL